MTKPRGERAAVNSNSLSSVTGVDGYTNGEVSGAPITHVKLHLVWCHQTHLILVLGCPPRF